MEFRCNKVKRAFGGAVIETRIVGKKSLLCETEKRARKGEGKL
jgi:hypothetical protein